MNSIELKFGIYVTGHRQKNPIDFNEYPMDSFFLQGYEKECLYITAYEVNFIKVF